MTKQWIRMAIGALSLLIAAASPCLASPRVWLMGAEADEAFMKAFRHELPESKVEPDAHDARRALALLRRPTGAFDADVLLLNCAPEAYAAADNAADVRAVLQEARRRGLQVLWFGDDAAPEVVNVVRSEGVMMIDYAAFSRSLLPKGSPAGTALPAKARARQGWFLGESVNQWWAACAPNNPNALHVRLWSGEPPAYRNSGPERVNRSARIDHVTEPELVRFYPKKRDHAPAVIFFPGGGYAYMGFLRNAKDLADRLNPLGMAVIGLKYRTGRGPGVPLLDAERAVRYVRAHAVEWGLDPARIGVGGQSAGANLVLNLAGHFDGGDPAAADRVERESSRPDFMVVLTSWNFGKDESSFTFPKDMPPVFLRHARNDTSFKLAEAIVAQLKAVGMPLNYRYLDTGGHGAFELAPSNPGFNWPDEFVSWLREVGLYEGMNR